MVTKISGDTGVDNIKDGIITSSKLASGVGGKTLQVLSTTKTDTFVTTNTLASGGAAITGLSVTITPSSTSSKFLLSCVLSCDGTSAVTQCYAWLARGSTKIGAGDAVGNRIGTGGRFYYASNDISGTIPMQYLDLPSTLSPITYNVYIATETAAGSVVVNRTISDTDNTTNGSRQSSTLTVMEIAG